MKSNNYRILSILSSLLEEGYPTDKVIEISKFQDNTHFINDLETELSNGISFDQALMNTIDNKRFKEYFDFYRLNNNISKAINESLNICKLIESFKKKLIKKLTYPIILLIFLVFFSLFVVYGLLPTVISLFNDFNIEMNTFTRIIFFSFKLIPSFVIVMSVTLAITLIFIIKAITNNEFQMINKINKIPIINEYLRKYYSLKFALYYNELLRNNYDATSIMHILFNYIDDNSLKMVIYEIDNHLKKGENLKDIIDSFPYFEKLFKVTFTFMLETNKKTKIIDDYVDLSLSSIEEKINKIIKIIIPLIYIFVGTFVITIYISIIIPMMNVVGSL
ncbi:MAG: hypothetical protein PHH04_04290 [Thomasclavelia sp.]|nr:hypothetical protein [Thomasclavelia sp.]